MDTTPAHLSQSPNRRQRSKPRTPLQERSSSQKNEASARLGREATRGYQDRDIFTTTPFPTKPQHILLPSTLRRQQSVQDGENAWPQFVARTQPGSRPSTSGQTDPMQEDLRAPRAPLLQLKRSVTALRDIYEAQAEKSRPSTAASSAARPVTSSSRLRSASSSEGLAGRNAWEELHKISSDDMALLPTLSRKSMEKMASQSSFASRAGQVNPFTSSPNYRTYGSSSPRIPVFKDASALSSDDQHQSSSSGMAQTSSSSPNFVRLGRSSSIAETLHTEQSSSSPIFVKLGTSSSGPRSGSSPTPSSGSSGSRKRKRDVTETEASFAARSRRFGSSPPYIVLGASSSEPSLRSPQRVMPSSPPQPDSANSQSIGTSSPVYRAFGQTRHISDSDSSSSTHANLQAALSSSPMPPIQYPVIRAPAPVSYALHVPKRVGRSSSTISEGQWISRLSPVPSEWDEGISRSGSKKSHAIEELDELAEDSDPIVQDHTTNESQVHIVPLSEDDHQQEAADELRALPRRGPIAYRPPPSVPTRSNSLYGTSSSSSGNNSQSRLDSLRESVDTRLNSMKSFAHSRQNSYMSSNIRPGSSGSQSATVIVPTWARRYYSGLYRDSFQYLYPSNSNSTPQIPMSASNDMDRMACMMSGALEPVASTVVSRNSGTSWQSIRNIVRNTIVDYVPSIVLPKTRPRHGAKKSHLTMGIGPLVSNPVDANFANVRSDPYRENVTIRRVSDHLPAADPRAHWAGITEEQQRNILLYENTTPYHSSYEVNRESSDAHSVYYDAASGQIIRQSRFTDGPRLHHDRRLNTGSSKSRGFGFPFNQKGRHRAPSIYDASTRGSWYEVDLRDAQVTCFAAGFICPILWFIGAFLPLPTRPETLEDVEKALYGQHDQSGEWRDLDVVARLRLERHIKGVEELKWQNARWWKRMNRWMCCVGLVVFVLIIVLAVIGTRNRW